MAVSICVACGGSFTIPGPDRAPYCFGCQDGAETAASATSRSHGGGGWLVIGLVFLLFAGFILYASVGREVGPQGTAYEGPSGPISAPTAPMPTGR